MMTIDSAPKEGTAHYFHASVYKFTMIARTAVITTFQAKVGNIAAHCKYNTKKDIFMLACPSSQGAFCDEVLYDVLTRYIDEELASAHRDRRLPEVHQFAESKWEWEQDREEESDCVADEDAPRVFRPQAVTSHTIMATGECRKLKFFRLHELPEAFLRRTLCPRSNTSFSNVINGLTCRAVCWQNNEGYLFNGCDGAESLRGSNNYQQVEYPKFPVLKDTRDQAVLDELDREEAKKAAASQTQARLPGPGVDSWLEAVDQTEQVTPDEAADLPKATKGMLAADEMHGFGRPRVPIGFMPGMTEQDDPSDDEQAPSVARAPFEVLMLTGTPGNTILVRSLSSSETSSVSSDSESTAEIGARGARGDFASLLPVGESNETPLKVGERPAIPNPAQMSGPPEHFQFQQRADPTTTISTTRKAMAPPSTVQDPAEFTAYDKKYAVVDNYGLTANPTLSALHALENDVPIPVKAKRQPVAPRVRKPQTDVDDSAHSKIGSISKSVASTSALTAHGNSKSAFPATWEQNINSGRAPTIGLIDATSTPLSRPLRPPPGFENISENHRQRDVPSTLHTVSHSLVDTTEVGLMDRSPPRVNTAQRPASSKILQPKLSTSRSASDTEIPLDKLAVFPPAFDRKRNTMNQKAGKNVKSKGKKFSNAGGKKIVAELPKPDPLPAPREKKVIEVATPNSRKQSMLKPGQRAKVDAPPPIPNEFQRVLSEIIEKQSSSDNEDDDNMSTNKACKLLLKFCQLLLLPDSVDFSKRAASSPEVIQEAIASSKPDVHYFPRLTSSILDAHKLIELMGAGVTPELVYEVRIKDATGVTLLCKIPARDKTRFTIKPRDDTLACELLHYPTHVWDARMSLAQPRVDHESRSHDAIVQFVSSMSTEDITPSFCAWVAPGSFDVEAVETHRIFENEQDSITFRVVEKQHLMIDEGFRNGRYNFRAVSCADEAEMVYEQRSWWEAMLETTELEKRQQVQDIATFIVETIDSVGLQNEGPWMVAGEDEEEKHAAPALLYDDLGRKHLAEKKNRRY